jgi:hypothetical protein
MSILLAPITNESIIIISIFVLTVLVSIGIVAALKHSEKRHQNMLTKREPREMNVKLNKEYISKKELNFLNSLYKALPAEFIAFPKVSLANLLVPGNDKVAYHLVEHLFVDVCIFVKDTMEPMMVVDLVENEASTLTFKEMLPIIRKTLSAVKIPVLSVKIQPTYDILKLRKDLISQMPDQVIVLLKQNLSKQ